MRWDPPNLTPAYMHMCMHLHKKNIRLMASFPRQPEQASAAAAATTPIK